MSIFTRYAMDALMKTTHPEVNRKQCWNLHPHRTPCTACKDICPYGDEIFTRPNLVKDWDPCTDCGLCVSACRSGCIAPSPEQVQRDISPADSDGDTIWIGCEKSTRKNTVVRTCVSAYSWEALAYLALNKKIVLDLTPCGECENDVCAEHLRAVLTRLVEFFGQPLFEARFTLAYELDCAARTRAARISGCCSTSTPSSSRRCPKRPCAMATTCPTSPRSALPAAGVRRAAAAVPSSLRTCPTARPAR